VADPIITAQGPQPAQGDESASGHIKVAAAVGGIGAAGFIPTKGGRIWDHYLRAIRNTETAFPGAILRTFRVSETLSPFETWNQVGISAEQMAVGGKYAEFLRNRFGPSIQDVTMTRTSAMFGEITSGGKAVGMGLRIKAGTQQGTGIADYFARITGTDMPIKGIGSGTYTASLNESLLKAEYLATRPPVPFGQWVEAMAPHMRTRDLIIGAAYREKVNFLGMDIMLDEKMRRHVARAETFVQLMRARAAATAGRLNILLSKPLEIPVIGSVLNKIPIVRSMAVKPGAALQMAGRYTGKALALGALWKGLEYYDYARSQGGVWSAALGTTGGAAIGAFMFKGPGRRFSPVGLAAGAAIGAYTALSPRFDSGLFHGVASIFTDANLARAQVSEKTGIAESLRRQEAITPGLISVKTALGFAGAGGLMGGIYQYGGLVRAALAKHAKEGGNFADTIEGLREVRAAEFGEKLWGSGIGKKIAKMPTGKFLSSKIKSPVALGMAAGLAAWTALSSGTSIMSGNFAAAIPGLNLLASKESPEELQQIYSGEKEVAVRKGRFWEFGRSSKYEGSRIEYFRPHMLARLKQRSYQKGIYGTEEEKWQYDPALHPLKALFGSEEWKYHYEMTHQYDRPAPLTSTYGEDVPFIGPLVSATFGKLVKPRKMVRPEEWNLGNGEYAYLPDIRGETEPAYELGGLKPGAPVAPEEPTQLMNELIYRRREAVGLVGYAEGIIQKAATGREEPFKNLQTMETMGKETGGEYWLWKHLNVGGALGASEPVRRFIPHTRSYLETYNPLANTMPSWIPDDYFMDLAHGNPFSKIPEAEMRLPGPGYCLHPDTKIETRHGYVPINDISVQTSVATSSGYRPVTKTFSRDYSGELICISSYGGLNETTKLTLQHEVKAIKTRKCKYHLSADKNRRPCKKSNFCTRMSCDEYLNNKIEWTQAQDLSEGDFVLRPISTTQFVDFIIDPIKIITNNSDLDYIGHDTYQTYRYQLGEKIKNKQISLTLPESIDLWFLFGLYLAEGSLSKSRVSLTLHKDESYLVNFISNLIMIKTRDRKEENAKVVDINNKAFAILVKAMFGQSSKKTIPVGISRSQFLALLSGWIQGDGYCSKESLELSISPKYKTLLSQLTYYCNIYNINYSLSKRKTRNEYVVRILASSVDEIQLLDYKQKDKTSICSKTSSDFTIDGHRAFKIKKIWKEWYSGPVCDLEVQDAHEYCTSFIVHNSSLHPELEGVAPEDYPLAHRVKILGDVAMWSEEYSQAMSKAKRNLNTLSDHDKSLVLMTEAQTKAKKESRREITPYRFRPELLQEQQVTVTDILDPRRIKTKEFGEAVVELQGFGAINDMQKAMEFAKDKLKGNLTLQVSSSESRRYNIGKNFSSVKAVAMIGDTDYGQILAKENLAQAEGLRDEFEQLRFTPAERLAGRISEAALHNVETPLEMLTPISPAAKLIRQRSAIEEYVASEAVGTGNAFWDRPVENFLRPTANMALKKIGFDQIPSEIRQRRDINEYFDMLSWTKSKQAERLADQNGDRQAAIAAKNNQQETLFGLDVFGSPVNIMKALPRRERDFYEAFSNAPTPEERAQIFSMVPENEQRVYLAAWVRQEEEAARAKKNSKIATEADEKTLIAAQMMRQTEGFGYTEDLETEWMKETGGQIPFDEWLREKKAAKYFSTHSLPGPDWLGWCVPPDQKILTSNCGFSNACDIKLDQILTTLQGENPVEQIFERETNEKLLTVRVHHNNVHSMSATKNHIILGIETVVCKYDLRPDSVCSCASNKWKCNFCTTKHYESYSARWMPIGEVTTNTYLPIPLLAHSETDPVFDIGLLDCFPKNTIITEDKVRSKTGIIKPMNRRVLMDEATCWLIGYYLAEGNVWAVGDRMRGVQFTSHINEVPILELAQKIIKDRFGLDSIIRFKKTPNSNSAYLVVASGLFGWLMNTWVGRFCDHKFAPLWIDKITRKSQVSLLDGLNTGDASKDDRGRLCLANQQLCEMAKRLYETQGIAASLRGPIKRGGKDQYIVEPLDTSLAVMIGENFIAYRVESIQETDYEGIVLDFGVSEAHMYCSPIGIYHNSPSVDMEDVKLKYVEMQGLDHHDFDIWGTRKRSLARKPYISEDLINQMGMQARFDEVMKTRSNAKAISKFYGGSGGSATVSYISAPMKERYNIEISDSRQGLIEDAYKHMGVR
jgi:hypothetical protein